MTATPPPPPPPRPVPTAPRPAPRAPRRRRATRARLLSPWALPAMGIVIVVPFVLLIVTLVNLRQVSDEVARDTLAYAADTAEEQVDVYVVDGANAAVDLAIGMDRGSITADIDALPDALIEVLERRVYVRSVAVGFPDGAYAMVTRDDVGFGYHGRTSSADGSAQFTYEWSEFMEEFTRVSDPIDASVFDMPFYRAGEKAFFEPVVWTEPSPSLDGRTVEVWASTPVFDEFGRVRAVVAAGIMLADLGDVMNGVAADGDAEVFLLGPDRRVLAGPPDRTDDVTALLLATGEVPTAREIGVSGAVMASPLARNDEYFQDDTGTVILERGLAWSMGVDWLVHVEATKTGLSPALTDIDRSLTAVVILMAVAMVVFLALLARFWKPVADTRRQALRDPLTGLLNRAAFQFEARTAVARTHRRGGNLVVAMMDLDGFKPLNDAWGHEAGDHALVICADALSASVRPGDAVVRWGGDEFLFALRVPPGEDAHAVVERIRSQAAGALAAGLGPSASVGATAGYAVSHSAEDSVAALIAAADSRLIAGKGARKGATYGPDAVHPAWGGA